MTARQMASAELCARCVGEGCDNCDGQGYTRLPFQPDDFSPKPPLNVLATPPDSEGPTDSNARNWTEDYSHENGQYVNHCLDCKNTFIGHKRRVICRRCSSLMPWTDLAKVLDVTGFGDETMVPLSGIRRVRALLSNREIDVLRKKLALRTVTRCQQCGAEALPSPTHALDLEAERNDARYELERAIARITQLESQLSRRVEG